jgi:hypothetical protein
MSIQKIQEMGMILISQPAYSPDIAPCDFLLFGYMKKHLEGIQFPSEEEVISAVSHILLEIPVETLADVMNEWICRLKQCIEMGGEYLP